MRKLLLVAALAVLAWIYVVPSCSTKFGCEAASATAHAADTECPSDSEQAAGDAAWAADRIATIQDDDLTAGLFYDEDGNEHQFFSGRDDEADKAVKVGRDAGVFPSRGHPFVVDHVEVKVAAAMRDADVMFGVLLINNPRGVCERDDDGVPKPQSCLVVAAKLLPEGSTMIVWWPDKSGPESETLVGRSQ